MTSSSSSPKTYVLETDTDPQVIKVLRRFDGIRRQDLWFVQAYESDIFDADGNTKWVFEPRRNPGPLDDRCTLVGPFSLSDITVHIKALVRIKANTTEAFAYLNNLVDQGEAIRWRDR